MEEEERVYLGNFMAAAGGPPAISSAVGITRK